MSDKIRFLFCYLVCNSVSVSALSEEFDTVLEMKSIKAQFGKVLAENEMLRQQTQRLEQLEQKVEQLTLVLEKNKHPPFQDRLATGAYKEIIPPIISRADDRSKVLNDGHGIVAVSVLEQLFPNTKGRDKRLLLPANTVSTTSQSGIAFSARISKTISNVGDGQDIPFINVETDTNNAFHGPTGIFTCPQDGVYVFQATLLTYPNKRVEFIIVKEGSDFASGYSYGTSNAYGTGTTSGITRLQTGDKVWVKVSGDGHTGTGEMIYGPYSSFIGFSVFLQ